MLIFKNWLFLGLFFIAILAPNINKCLADDSLFDKNYILGSGDVIDIQIWDNRELNNNDLNIKVRIMEDGGFNFPLIGRVDASGLSVSAVEAIIKEKLVDGYLINPEVIVSVFEFSSQKVFISGEVVRPGTYTLKGRTTLAALISEAGGLTDEAGITATILRSDREISISNISSEDATPRKTIMIGLDNKSEDVEGQNDVLIMAGDIIEVSKKQHFFVTGEVNNPGKYSWEDGLTVLEAVSLAGGASQRGSINRTSIIRIENGQEKKLKPKLSDRVRPSDIISVPESYF